ncbi:hypothetical protein SAY86_015528 [Trapa natans]|uniref:glucan endo-1,3-beta-D-glucosidase n=1 Tax=Trapa natans TaxID=22666 RepID=A0AAN7QYL1_TRANT|nr:hypothetical protein SAY86_015528 [Trapa natans]
MEPILVAFLFLSLFCQSKPEAINLIGVNYGMLGNNLPSPAQSVAIIRTMNFTHVKLYDANTQVLKLLSGTNIHVTIMVQNHEIPPIAGSQALADKWVATNVLQYYPNTMVQFILVGNEVLSYTSEELRGMWQGLVPAMKRIRVSLRAKGIRRIKVSTPLAMDVLESTFPPSSARFRPDLAHSVVAPLLHFLNGTRSYFFLDVYPYFPWSADPETIELDFALLQGDHRYTDPGSGLVYTSLLDQMLDSAVFAMAGLGYRDIPLLISETGWPNDGDIDELGVNIRNAATYNRNLIRKLVVRPPVGTPARPGATIPVFIFSLFSENRKAGRGSERHWGLVNPNGTSIYEIDLSGEKPASGYEPLPVPNNDEPYKGKLWCVAGKEKSVTELAAAIEYACGSSNGTCDGLMPGRECYGLVSVPQRASYAFSSYWARFRSQGGTCYFDGLAEQTTANPSDGSCMSPSVTV